MSIIKKVLFYLIFTSHIFAQERVQGDISTKDTANLSILGVYQDQFPNVSVVFRAEKTNGVPVFGLTIEDMNVSENGEVCDVISIYELSKKKPINIGVVLDHSGSMLYDEQQLIELGTHPWFLLFDEDGNPLFPDDYIPPINTAKEALNSFVSTFNFDKDRISVVGFSSRVDKVLKLSNNETVINNMIKSMEADSMTAFYDALMVGIQQVKEEEGLNVLVALTDGNDNMSKNTYKEVISYAKESNVPIYLIGLGNVNTDSLKLLADNTDGQFFYANSATVLNEIYDKISTKLQAFYDMTYISPNLEVDSNERSLEITFIKEGIHLITEKERFDIDENVLAYMFEKEAEKKRLYLIYGGLGLAVLVAGGIFFHFYSKRKNVELKIAKVYPNPTTGIVTLIIENNKSKEGLLTVFNQSGNQVQQEKISSNSEVNLEHLPSNLYFLSVSFDGNNSKPVKLLKK